MSKFLISAIVAVALSACAATGTTYRQASPGDALLYTLQGMQGAFQPAARCVTRQDITGTYVTQCQ